MAKFEPTTPNMSQHVATGRPNARNLLRPTMLRYVALPCCDRLAGALRSVTFIATFASRAKSIARVHDAHESLMFLPDCTPAFRGIFSSENS